MLKIKLIVFLAVYAVVGATYGKALVKVADEDVLFLAHFNNTVMPEVYHKKESDFENNAKLTTGENGYPFKNAGSRNEALDVCRNGKYIIFPAEGNFDPGQGTLQMWIKPQWRNEAYAHCVFFKLIFSPNKREQLEWNGANSFILQKRPKVDELVFLHNGKSIISPITHSENAWLQLGATWDGEKRERTFYINGEPVGKEKYHPMTAVPMEFTLGAQKTWNAQSLIDEVRIIRRVLTPQEIKQDYLAQKNGMEFAIPVRKKQPAPELIPISVDKQAVEKRKEVNFFVSRINRELVLDGKLSELEWTNAQVVSQMEKRHGGDSGRKTDIKLLYSATALYIGAVIHEKDMGKLLTQYDQHDQPIYNDDSLEIILEPSNRIGDYYQIVVNTLGYVYDSKAGDRAWNLRGISVKTSRMDQYWTIEMKLPFSAFGIPAPLPGESWGARFTRNSHYPNRSVGSIPFVEDGGYNQRAYLGNLNFISSTASSKILLSSNAKNYQMGYNLIPISMENNSSEERQLKLSALMFNNAGKHSNTVLLEKFTLKMGEKKTMPIPLIVKDDDIARIVISVIDEKGNAEGGVTLDRGFIAIEPGILRLSRELDSLWKSLADLLMIDHPIYGGTARALETMQEKINLYQQKLTAAIKMKTIVPEEESLELSAWINGFNHFREQYRYLLFPVSPWEIGSPTALPPVALENLQLQYTQAGNEREINTFAITGLLCNRRMDLRIVPQPVDQKGAVFISDDNFEVYMEPFVDHNGDLITAPLIRAPGNIITVTPGNVVRVWVVFNSRGVPAGEYHTRIDIKPLNDYSIPTREIPVALKVWDFSLPETRNWPLKSFFWTGQFTPLDETAMLRLLHDYHITHTMTESINYKTGFARDRRARNKIPNASGSDPYDEKLVRTANEEFFQEAKRLGMKFVFGWGTAKELKWHQLVSDRLLKMGFTFDDFIFKGLLRDEFMKKDIPVMQKERAEVKAGNPGWKFQAVYLSTPPPTGATLQDIEKAGLTDFYKMWTIIHHRLADPKQGKETVDYFKSRGCEVWTYRCSRNMQTLAVLDYYRFYPWEGYLRNLDGIAYWSSFSAKNDGFDHRDGYDDGITWRGINKAPIPTKRLEAVREGLEDVAYMDILKKNIVKAKEKFPQKNFSAEEMLISKRPREVIQSHSQQQLDKWRLEAGEAIDRLVKLNKSGN